MAALARLIALAAFAALALLGLALGAESQREFVLESDITAQGELAASGAAGNLVILTGLLVAIGATGCLLLLSRLPVPRRLAPAGAFAVACYGGVLLGQTMWPYYVALVDYRYARLANSLLAANLDASPSVVLGPMALLLAVLLVAGWSLTRLLGRPQPPPTPEGVLRVQAAAVLLAAPFLAIMAWGNLRLLIALPDDQPGLGPAFVVLPAITLGCLALAGLALAKTWQLGTYVRNARLAAAAQESWQALGRAEAAIVAVLAGLAVAGSFLQPLKLEDYLSSGEVLGMTLRVHTQLTVLLAIPLVPALVAHRRVTHLFDGAPLHPANLDDTTDPIARLTAGAVGASMALTALATWVIGPPLWAWLLAFLPVATLAAVVCGARLSAVPVLLGAFTLWAIGNTVQATYDGSQGTAVLVFAQAPGVLALWRTLGAVLAAAALGRLARGLGDGRLATLPLAAGVGFAAAAVALLEMPLTAWLLNRPGVDAIAVGSVVASLDPPVRAIVHTVAVVLAVTAALLVALLHRPDWFARRPREPVAVIRPKAQRRPANAPA